MDRNEAIEESAGSVFHALELDDADDLVLRAELMRRATAIIRQRGLTQTEAAAITGIDQPRISALVNGRISLFSSDRLIRLLRDLGQDVELRITPSTGARGQIVVAA